VRGPCAAHLLTYLRVRSLCADVTASSVSGIDVVFDGDRNFSSAPTAAYAFPPNHQTGQLIFNPFVLDGVNERVHADVDVGQQHGGVVAGRGADRNSVFSHGHDRIRNRNYRNLLLAHLLSLMVYLILTAKMTQEQQIEVYGGVVASEHVIHCLGAAGGEIKVDRRRKPAESESHTHQYHRLDRGSVLFRQIICTSKQVSK